MPILKKKTDKKQEKKGNTSPPSAPKREGTSKAAKKTDTAEKKVDVKKTDDKVKNTQSSTKSDQPPTLEQVLAEQIKDDPKLDLVVEWKEVKPSYDRVIQAVARNLKVDGFRPGKVPASIAEERVRPEYLVQEVTKLILQGRLQKLLDEAKEKPDAEPNVIVVSAQKGKDWTFAVLLPQKTEVKLPEYKKFLTKKKKEVRETIAKMQEEAKTRALKDGRKLPPEMDEAQIKARATDEALMALLQEIKPVVSRTLVQRGAEQEYQRLVNQLSQYQVTWEDYLKNSGITEEILSGQLTLRALENIQMEFMLDALMTAEKVTASEEEMREKMKEVMPEVTSEEDKKRQLEEPNVRAYLEMVTKRQKLANWLLEL